MAKQSAFGKAMFEYACRTAREHAVLVRATPPPPLRVVNEEERDRALQVRDYLSAIDTLRTFLADIRKDEPEGNPLHTDRAKDALEWFENRALERDSDENIPF